MVGLVKFPFHSNENKDTDNSGNLALAIAHSEAMF